MQCIWSVSSSIPLFWRRRNMKKAGKREHHLWMKRDSAGSRQKASNLVQIIKQGHQRYRKESLRSPNSILPSGFFSDSSQNFRMKRKPFMEHWISACFWISICLGDTVSCYCCCKSFGNSEEEEPMVTDYSSNQVITRQRTSPHHGNIRHSATSIGCGPKGRRG